jgi:hypothetical protein
MATALAAGRPRWLAQTASGLRAERLSPRLPEVDDGYFQWTAAPD